MQTTYPVKLFLKYSRKRSQRSTNENLCFEFVLIMPVNNSLLLTNLTFSYPCFGQTIFLNQNWYKKWRPSRSIGEDNQGLQYISFISKTRDSSSNIWTLGSVSSIFYQWLVWFSGKPWKHMHQKKFYWERFTIQLLSKHIGHFYYCLLFTPACASHVRDVCLQGRCSSPSL